MLSDPFGVTAELARKRTEDLQQGIGTLASGATQMAQGQQTQNLLKQFGILTEKDNPYSIDEIKDIAQKKFGTEININSTLPKEEQSRVATQLLEASGIKLPKRTTPEINLDRAAHLGMQYDPSPFGGTVKFAPKKPEKTIYDFMTEATAVEKAKSEGTLPQGYSYAGKSGIKPTTTTGLSEEDKNSLADLMLSGKLAPNEMPAFGQSRAEILKTAAKKAKEQGIEFNPKQLDIDYFGQKVGTNNLQRLATNLIPAENTFRKNADLTLKLFREYSQTNSPAINKALLVWRGQATGDADTQRLIAATWATASEYAKLVTNNGFTGNLTDTARKEVENILSASQSLEQAEGLLDPDKGIMSLEAGNRIQGVKDAMKYYNIPMPTQQGQSVTDVAGLGGQQQPTQQKTGMYKGKKVISNDGGKSWEYL